MTLNTNGIASDVTGKRILITGGASGIGAASALLLASRGAITVPTRAPNPPEANTSPMLPKVAVARTAASPWVEKRTCTPSSRA